MPFGLAALACDSSSSSPAPAIEVPDAQLPNVDGAVPDAKVLVDGAAPDASDAAAEDASVPLPAVPFATGLGANGVALADKQIDPHWTITDVGGAAFTAYAQTDALGYEGFWMPPTAASKFISPFIDTVDPATNTTFTYTTSFELDAQVVLANVQLVVHYASDNAVSGIKLNGTALDGVVAQGYGSFADLTVTNGNFVTGKNTVSISVLNESGPTGMRAEFALTK